MIGRPSYLERLTRWKDKDIIKVITGVRRCGKSTLLTLFRHLLLEQGVPSERIVSINLEQMENERLLDPRALHDEVLRHAAEGRMTYVLLDEVQNVPDFQRVVDSLHTHENIDLYITGSNALLLGGTLATLLSGRYVEINMLPLSFAEYRSSQPSISPTRLYGRYIDSGSMPAIRSFSDDSLAVYDYLRGILNTVLLKDVLQRLNAANSIALERLAAYMFDNIGNICSSKGIADALTSSGTKISANTVDAYLSALCDAFIFYRAPRYDIRGKRLLRQQEKFYAVDMGMRKTMLSGRVRDTGRILENVIYLELKRRYSEVYTGHVGTLEVDFVAIGQNGPDYYQVAETVRSERTLERELTSLETVRDNRPKTILVLDDTDPIDHDGIMVISALDWMLQG